MTDLISAGRWGRVVVTVAILCEVVCPAILVIALASPVMFAALDTTKLLFIAVAVGLPAFTVNVLIAYHSEKAKKRQGERRDLGSLRLASHTTMLPLLVAAAVIFVVRDGAKLDDYAVTKTLPQIAAGVVAGVEIVVAIALLLGRPQTLFDVAFAMPPDPTIKPELTGNNTAAQLKLTVDTKPKLVVSVDLAANSTNITATNSTAKFED